MGEKVTLGEAAKRLGISRVTMSNLAKSGRFTVYENPLDRRQRLVDMEEVEAAVELRPLRHTESPEQREERT